MKCPLWQIFCSSKNLGHIILLPCLVVKGTILILKDDYILVLLLLSMLLLLLFVVNVHVDVCLSC